MKIMSTITFKFRLLAILACVLCALGASAYSFYVDSIYYNITGPNTVEVTYKSYSTADYSGNVVIPSTVTYDNVTYDRVIVGSPYIEEDGENYYDSSINFTTDDYQYGYTLFPALVTQTTAPGPHGYRRANRLGHLPKPAAGKTSNRKYSSSFAKVLLFDAGTA